MDYQYEIQVLDNQTGCAVNACLPLRESFYVFQHEIE